MNLENQNYKFRGGFRVGLLAVSWPNGLLEVSSNSIILHDEMFKKDYKFSKDEITKIEIKKIFPVIGYGIRLHHTNQNYNNKIIFWYVSFHFKNLVTTLEELGWLTNNS